MRELFVHAHRWHSAVLWQNEPPYLPDCLWLSKDADTPTGWFDARRDFQAMTVTSMKILSPESQSHRPKAVTVFAAAFIAGAVAAVALNRALDVHLAQSKPQVESEPIFVALRSLPAGAPVTVWDIGLRDWPKAMMPSTAMRAEDTFDGLILRQPLREGQPILTVQLAKTPSHDSQLFVGSAGVQPVASPAAPASTVPQADLWGPNVQAQSLEVPPLARAASPAAVVAQPATTVEHSMPTTVGIEAGTAAQPTLSGAADIDAVGTAVPPPSKLALALAEQAFPPEPTLAKPTGEQEQAALKSASQPISIATRYLVVPERIALQADLSFVTPMPPVIQPTVPAEGVPSAGQSGPASKKQAMANPAQTPRAARGPQAGAPSNKYQSPGSKTSRQHTSSPRSASVPVPFPPTTEKSELTEKPKFFGSMASMFPNIAAGIDAVESELKTTRLERAEQAAAKPQPTNVDPPSQPALRPFYRPN